MATKRTTKRVQGTLAVESRRERAKQRRAARAERRRELRTDRGTKDKDANAETTAFFKLCARQVAQDEAFRASDATHRKACEKAMAAPKPAVYLKARKKAGVYARKKAVAVPPVRWEALARKAADFGQGYTEPPSRPEALSTQKK